MRLLISAPYDMPFQTLAVCADKTARPDGRGLSFPDAFPDRDFTSQTRSKASNPPFPHGQKKPFS